MPTTPPSIPDCSTTTASAFAAAHAAMNDAPTLAQQWLSYVQTSKSGARRRIPDCNTTTASRKKRATKSCKKNAVCQDKPIPWDDDNTNEITRLERHVLNLFLNASSTDSGKNAFLFALVNRRALALQLIQIQTDHEGDELWRCLASRILRMPYSSNVAFSSLIDRGSMPHAMTSDGLRDCMDNLCHAWGCATFLDPTVDFEPLWWDAARYAQYWRAPDNIAVEQCEIVNLIYLVTHLVYTGNAYMSLSLSADKLAYFKTHWVAYIVWQQEDLLLQAYPSIRHDNFEMLVEICDFFVALNQPIPDQLWENLCTVTESTISDWISNDDDQDSVAHMLFLYYRLHYLQRSKSCVNLKFLLVTQSSVSVHTRRLTRKRTSRHSEVDHCSLNASQAIDCLRSCPGYAGHPCTNQRLRCRFPLVHVQKTKFTGFGLFASEAILPGQIIAEYEGEVKRRTHQYSNFLTVDVPQRVPRTKFISNDRYDPNYAARLDTDTFICPRTNSDGVYPNAAYSNHSCEPNSMLVKWSRPDEPFARLWLQSLKFIDKNEEIVHRYITPHWKQRCRCHMCRTFNK
jgi:hypothetical protein